MKPPRLILVADDDENDLRMTLAALAQRGTELEVRTVHDGAEALDYLHGCGNFSGRPPGNPTLLLLDLNMPRVDGWGVLRQVKADAILRTIPVVVFTSSSRDSDVKQCYDLGANAYVVKPIAFKEFTAVVHDIEVFWTERNQPPVSSPAGEAVAAQAVHAVHAAQAAAPAGSPP